MNREDLLELITTEDVIKIMEDLGSEDYKKDSQGNLYFLTVCHGSDSYKLYYFSDSKFFKCLTCCGIMSLFDVIMSVREIPYNEAYEYICDFKHISRYKKMRIGLQKIEIQNKDLDFLKIHLYKKEKQMIKLPSYDNYILNVFDDYSPLSWYKEGITDEISDYFNIKFYMNQKKAIIPHYDIYGNLVGIRARSFNQYDVDNGKKYMPITIQGLTYRYPMSFNLYGIYQNQDNIRKFKRVIIFESEKSVMLYGSYYGQEDNIAVALCGMTLSIYQRDLLLSLGVEEVVIILDKQYQIELIDDKDIDKSGKVWKEYEGYIKTLIKISEMLIDYCNVSIILCWDNRISHKDSPIDCGKEMFEELYKERYSIENTDDLKELIKGKEED